MIKFLANENFPLQSVHYLRSKGFDVKSIGADDPSILDKEVMQKAIDEDRTILTFDRDYGELIFKYHYRPDKGVIYLRFESYAPDIPGKVIEELLSINDLSFQRALTVLDKNGMRQRKY